MSDFTTIQQYDDDSFIDMSDYLKDLDQWCVCDAQKRPKWRGETVDHALHNQSFNEAFELAQENSLYVGFSIRQQGDIVGLDFDSCRDPSNGQFDAWVMPWLDLLAGYGYFDISPSKTGIKVLVRGHWPTAAASTIHIKDKSAVSRNGKQPAIEVYQGRRFFALTGESLPGYSFPDIRDAQPILEKLLLTYPFEKRTEDFTVGSSDLDRTKPGDHFNQDGLDRTAQLLEEHGWTIGPPDAHGQRPVTRPGKTSGRSGTLGIRSAAGRLMLHVFSSSVPDFDPGSYSLTMVVAKLEFKGSFERAASWCRSEGFGECPDDGEEGEEEPSESRRDQIRNAFCTPARVLFDEAVGKIRRQEGDVLFEVPDYLTNEESTFEIGPGLLTVLGAPPGAGKTSLCMAALFEIMDNEPDLQVFLANCEMSFGQLARREMARKIEGLSARDLRFCDFDYSEHLDSVEDYSEYAQPIMDRMQVMNGPFTITSLQKLPLFFPEPGLLVVDYLQRFAEGDDARVGVNKVIDELRKIASLGWAVIAIAATSRDQKKGHRQELTLSSFRESGEIEYGADTCYVLQHEIKDDDDDDEVAPEVPPGPPTSEYESNILQEHAERCAAAMPMTLRCVKNRNGALGSIPLFFEPANMDFFGPMVQPKPLAEFAEFSGPVVDEAVAEEIEGPAVDSATPGAFDFGLDEDF